MRAITDASVKGGKSTHSFILETWQGKTIKRRKFTGFADRSTEAEMNTIESLLKYCLEKGFDRVTIYSDCQRVVNSVNKGYGEKIDTSYLQHLLKITNSKLRWTKRSKVGRCDYDCRHVHQRKIKKGYLINKE